MLSLSCVVISAGPRTLDHSHIYLQAHTYLSITCNLYTQLCIQHFGPQLDQDLAWRLFRVVVQGLDARRIISTIINNIGSKLINSP